MQTLQPFKNKLNSFCRCVILATVLGAGLGQSTGPGGGGCATTYVPPPLPQSEWGGHYAFSYQPTGEAKPAASVPVTVAVVNPSYKVEDSVLAAEPYRKIGKGLSASMGTDLDRILITKGVTTTGPFPSLDEITYSDKKGAALTLAPQVFITMEIKNSGPPQQIGDSMARAQGATPLRTDQDFVMNVTGWITFIMQEPLSGEKMWIKKLELDPVTVRGVISTESTPQFTDGGFLVGPIVSGYTPGKILYDGRPDALADALKQIYPIVMSRFEKYIDTDELVQLKDKGKEIRASNVFIGK
jgi:hypothetical protein